MQDMDALGYTGVFLGRTGGKPDGCAVFWCAIVLPSGLVPALHRSARSTHATSYVSRPAPCCLRTSLP